MMKLRGNSAFRWKVLTCRPTPVVYYYTYGSVLSALSRPQQNYCPEALDVFAEVRQAFGGDQNIMPIVQAGEAICQGVAEKMGTPAPRFPDVCSHLLADAHALVSRPQMSEFC